MMRRIFIAISPAAALQQRLTELLVPLQGSMPSWRWIRPADIHLTLRFLGNVSTNRLDAICQALTCHTQAQPPFLLSARSLGCFPTPVHPRVLWVGIDDISEALRSLYDQVSTALVPLGFPREDRPFRPHLTLARAKPYVVYRQLDVILQQYRGHHIGNFLVQQLYVFQSQLRPGGPLYTVLHTIPLQR